MVGVYFKARDSYCRYDLGKMLKLKNDDSRVRGLLTIYCMWIREERRESWKEKKETHDFLTQKGRKGEDVLSLSIFLNETRHL